MQENILIREQINNLFSHIDDIPKSRKYWLIRTESGRFYDDFVKDDFVALGYEQLKISEYHKLKLPRENFLTNIKAAAEKSYPDNHAGLIASQITKFIYDVKINDIVVIPSENSEMVSFGIVSNNNTFFSANVDDVIYSTRRKVRWLRTYTRRTLDPYLYKVFQAHQAINDISKYDYLLERSLGSFYRLEDNVNLVLEVNQESNIKATNLMYYGSDLLTIVSQYIEEHNLNFDISDIEVKINVNSKGKIQFLSKTGKNLLLIGIFVLAINGGGIKIDNPNFKVDMSTDGLIKNVNQFLNERQDRQLKERLYLSADSLKIESPEDLLELLKQFSTNKDKPK